MRMLSWAFLVVSLTTCANPSYSDFRNSKWGMSPEQVIKSDEITLMSTNIISNYVILYGFDDIKSFKTELYYHFENNKLISSMYLISNTVDIDYKTIKQLLLDKYGNAKFDYNDYSSFESGNTIIELIFHKSENSFIRITYWSKSYHNKMMNEAKQRENKKL